MTFELFGDRGRHLGPFSSAVGLNALDKMLRKRRSRWPEFNQFMQRGEAMVTPELLSEVRDFIEAHKTKSNRRSVSVMVRSIASELLQTLERTKTKRARIRIEI